MGLKFIARRCGVVLAAVVSSFVGLNDFGWQCPVGEVKEDNGRARLSKLSQIVKNCHRVSVKSVDNFHTVDKNVQKVMFDSRYSKSGNFSKSKICEYERANLTS